MDQKLIPDDVQSYGSTDSNDDTSSYNFDFVINNIYTINSNCRFLEQASKAIGTTKDNIKLRNSVQSTLFTSKTIIDETKIELRELVNGSRKRDKNYKLQLEKLKNTFQDTVQVYSNLQQVLLIKLRRNLPSEPCPITQTEHKRVDYIYDDEEELLSLQQSFQKTLEDQGVIIEREDAIRKIETDMLDIRDIQQDLATIIISQGATVDRIENAVVDTYEDVDQGRQEIEKATAYLDKKRKRLLILFLLLLAIVAILGVSMYFTFKRT